MSAPAISATKSVLSMLGVAIAGAVGTAALAAAAPPGGRIAIVNANSGLCLTIAGGGTGRNATAVQYACDGDRSRDWHLRVSR
jgi:hypothetical protein